MPCRFPGPHPRGQFRGIWPGGRGVSRPTPKGEVEGDLVQAHTQEGSWGGSGPGPHPRGELRGIWSRPTPKGAVEGDLAGGVPAPRGVSALGGACSVEPPHDHYCCRRYASYWNAFLLHLSVILFTEGCVCQPLGRHPLGRHPPYQTATAADSMHPTGMHCCLLFKFWRTSVLFVRPLILLVWTSSNFCPGRDLPWFVCFLNYVQWIPKIHLWCNTHWPLDSQHGSRGIWSTYLHMCTGIGGTQIQDEMCGALCALTVWAIPTGLLVRILDIDTARKNWRYDIPYVRAWAALFPPFLLR